MAGFWLESQTTRKGLIVLMFLFGAVVTAGFLMRVPAFVAPGSSVGWSGLIIKGDAIGD